MSSNSESGNEMAGFLDLPAEIRNTIYENRVLARTEAGKRKSHSVTDFRVRRDQLMPLMLADKRIGNEILPIFFGDKLLHLTDEQTRCPKMPRPFSADGDSPNDNDHRTMVHYSAPECVQCPDELAHRVLGGRNIELPPRKWRHLFKCEVDFTRTTEVTKVFGTGTSPTFGLSASFDARPVHVVSPKRGLAIPGS